MANTSDSVTHMPCSLPYQAAYRLLSLSVYYIQIIMFVDVVCMWALYVSRRWFDVREEKVFDEHSHSCQLNQKSKLIHVLAEWAHDHRLNKIEYFIWVNWCSLSDIQYSVIRSNGKEILHQIICDIFMIPRQKAFCLTLYK